MVNNYSIQVYYFTVTIFFLEQINAYIEKMNIKESAFRVLELEFSNAQKYIDKLNLDIITMKKNKEKYLIAYICYHNIFDFIKYLHHVH